MTDKEKALEVVRRLGMEPTVEERRKRIVQLLAIGAVRAARAKQGLPPLPEPDRDEDSTAG
jgi:hypothetical protein